MSNQDTLKINNKNLKFKNKEAIWRDFKKKITMY